MKAAIYEKYGPPEVLQIKDVEKPTPKDNEVLIKIYATTVSSADHRMRSFDVPLLLWLPFRAFSGFFGPRVKILGQEMSGFVEAVGKDVTRLKVGDEVFGSTYGSGSGGYAEYVCLSDKEVIDKKPSNLTFEEASAVFFGSQTSLHFLRKANIKEGQKVLIHGASGCLGTYGVQIAKYYGAEVTAVCSGKNAELVKSLGADHVIDYTEEDFTQGDEKYDVIYCTVGKSPFSDSVKSLKENGVYLRAVHLTFLSILQGIWTELTTSKKVIGGVAGQSIEDLNFLRKLCEEERLRPVIDRTYSLEQIVDAHRYVDEGRKKGNVVIKVINNNNE